MHGIRLLEYALDKGHETVLDVGPGRGRHAQAFISRGSHVTGIDVQEPPFEHEKYTHINNSFERAAHNSEFETAPFDAIWSCHALEHIPNTQSFLVEMHRLLKPDGCLYLVVPSYRGNRMHVGHLSIWTPGLLIYNMICAGWNCVDAKWYTEYTDIAVCLQNAPEIDLDWRTGMPGEVRELNQYTPRMIRTMSGAWWGNNWHEETDDRVTDPPGVTAGFGVTNLPPEVQLAYGPNPNLRKPPGTGLKEDAKDGSTSNSAGYSKRPA